MLLFYRRRNLGGASAGGGRSSGPRGLSDPIRPDVLDDMRVEVRVVVAVAAKMLRVGGGLH